ncbi:hypothetical protein J2795_003320 [Chryseobacterium bernardetii]|uniref:Uncharacterized protein DUF4180 n=2 Tax=Chryseobacterium TaxID=59732 RepID=A0A543EK99_9FLAO|nr:MULTISPECIES: DUF4180 domain-containing protein [Chryseobacterium]MDR6372022.1 hypothetical protein [Chryseobacterium vietnamense]MDR6442595.1 hypothetical protein [Chryseobacterium bernardetii]TQM22024.1 uncharacterized protein DUF4180 [Chryseobacterium aquifrigidense]
MIIKLHEIHTLKIAEIISDDIIIQSAQDGLDLMGDIYYQGFDKVILHEKNITPEFFDLKTKMAGEILQKFSNYRIGLAIVGNFNKYESKSMKDFIFESNTARHVNFVSTVDDALNNFSK